MIVVDKKVKEIRSCTIGDLPEALLTSEQPYVIKGLCQSWPVVKAGQQSARHADEYIRRFYRGQKVGVFHGQPEIAGRYAYNEDLSNLNFDRAMVPLDQVLDKIFQHLDDAQPPSFYVGSTAIEQCLPGFESENNLFLQDKGGQEKGLLGKKPHASIWIGNQSRISAHFDLPDNIAVNAVGKRRFTLFPPEQLENLYIGPLEFNPAGQAISLVDFHQPDYNKYPKFKQAIEQALVAELEPGDALFIPAMWWHHVESLARYNILVNYWWRQSPDFMETPAGVLTYAQMTIRDLPPAQKAAWKNLFEYYVFGDADKPRQHIPPHSQGSLAPMNENIVRRLRSLVLNRLNR
ncbi:cupin-like domain-containing protein [Catenovulum sediminis]|uniref:Cupin-like domain-containing protein n=1 Tax=Catenovulum sediminis TaxID=1740262 RepID=A0ABV1RLS3_9ALTE|nr:cupin-like domain-containing protein [Catenovulum sediminis]